MRRLGDRPTLMGYALTVARRFPDPFHDRRGQAVLNEYAAVRSDSLGGRRRFAGPDRRAGDPKGPLDARLEERITKSAQPIMHAAMAHAPATYQPVALEPGSTRRDGGGSARRAAGCPEATTTRGDGWLAGPPRYATTSFGALWRWARGVLAVYCAVVTAARVTRRAVPQDSDDGCVRDRPPSSLRISCTITAMAPITARVRYDGCGARARAGARADAAVPCMLPLWRIGPKWRDGVNPATRAYAP
jgi:hypothetical protein